MGYALEGLASASDGLATLTSAVVRYQKLRLGTCAFKPPSAVATTPSECTHLLLRRECSTERPVSHGWESLATRGPGGLVPRRLYPAAHSASATRGIRTPPKLLKPIKKIRILKKEKFRSFDYSDIPIKKCTSTILIRLAGRLAVARWRGSMCATKNNDARCGVSVVFRSTKDTSQHTAQHTQDTQHIQDKNIKIQISKNIIHKNYKLQKRSQKITQNHTTYSSSCAACGFDRHLLRDCATTTPLRHGNRKPETSVGPQVRTFTTSCARRGLLSSG